VAPGVAPLAHRNAERMAAGPRNCTPRPSNRVLDQLLESHGDKWRHEHATQYSSMTTYAKSPFNVAVGDHRGGRQLSKAKRKTRGIGFAGESARHSALPRCAAFANRDRCRRAKPIAAARGNWAKITQVTHSIAL
jgi:hypothetical protein